MKSIFSLFKSHASQSVHDAIKEDNGMLLQHFEAIFEQTGDGLQLVDRKGNIFYASPSIKELTGYSPEEVCKFNVFDLVEPSQKEELEQKLTEILARPLSHTPVQVLAKHKNRGYVWFDAAVTNLLDNPAVNALVLTIRDIDQQKKLEESLKEKLRLLDLAHDAIFIQDKEKKIIYWNKGAQELYGYTAKEAMGKVVSQLLHTVFPKGFDIDTYFQDNKSWEGRLTHRAKEGKEILVSSRWACSATQILQVNRDITHQTQLYHALEASKKYMDTIMEHVPNGITIQDATGKFVYINRQAMKEMGYKNREEALSSTLLEYQRLFDFYDESGAPLPVEHLPGRRAVSGEKNQKAIVKIVHKKTQQEKWMVLRSVAITQSDGESNVVITVMSDITQLKAMEQRKDDFISMASHELKTPLTSLMLYSQYLMQKLTDRPDLLSYAGKINGQLHKLENLIKELLDVTNIQRGKFSLRKERFFLEELVRETVDTLNPLSGHDIQFRGGEKVEVYADKERIAQVLINLIGNAMKYAPETTKIIVRSQKKGNDMVVSVKDFGLGISKEDQEKIFERFYQAFGKQQTYPGLGLGLYISSHIIALHKGRLWVESKKGKGSTFSFTLPIKE